MHYSNILKYRQYLKAIPVALVIVAATTFSVAAWDENTQIVSAAKSKKGVAANERRPEFVENEILVKFREGVSESKKERLHSEKGAKKIRDFKPLRLHRLKLKKGVSVEEAMAEYKADQDVEYAEPNYIVSINNTPDDPKFGELWGLANSTRPGADIDAPAAWDISTGSSSVAIAVIDTGIDYTHEDLAANIWVNAGEIPGNGIDDDSNGYIDDIYGINAITGGNPIDDHGHGTHIAGTIGAVGNNSLGVVGVNWSVKIVACKFLDASGSGNTADAIECILYLNSLKKRTLNPVNIVASNNSWGGGDYSQALFDAINAGRDTLFIAAAGNNSSNSDGFPNYPSSYKLPNVVSVAATDHNDNKAIFSNYGRRSVHLSAPGVNILSTLPTLTTGTIAGGYGLFSGTSMATPHVTGLAALIKAQNPSRNWIATKNLLISGGDNLGSMYERTISGKRINAYGSLSCYDRPVFSIIQAPSSLSVGTSVTLSALSINCAAPVGPVTVRLSGAETVNLKDDGITPDLVAGDGVFTAMWNPIRAEEILSFSSPAGNETVEYPSLAVATLFLPNGQLNTLYSEILSPKGGYQPYYWSVVSGALPQGMSLNGATGELSGVPSWEGNYVFTIQVVDAYGAKALKDFAIDVFAAGMYAAWSRTENSNLWHILYYDNLVGNLRDVAVDPSGNIYVTQGIYNVDFDFFLVKYDSFGNSLWSRSFDKKVNDQPKAVAVDKEGYSYVGGNSSADSISEFLLIKYDPNGEVVWNRTYAGYPLEDIAVDENGFVYVTGKKGGDEFILKYDSAGNFLWQKKVENIPSFDGSNIKTDKTGNIYVAGYNYYTAGANITADVALAKYDSSGNMLWHKIFDNGGRETGQDVAVDTSGNVYVTGWTMASPPSLLLIKYDPAGNLLWSESYAEGFGSKGFGAAIDKYDHVYIAGSIQRTPYGDTDLLTLKYDSSGQMIWATTLNRGDAERGERLVLDNDGNIFVTGSADSKFTYALTVKYTDPDAFFISNAALPSCILEKPYNVTLSAKGGSPPYSWSIVSGSLPPGLALDSATGALSGIAISGGAFPFTVKLTDAAAKTITRSFSIKVYDDDLSVTRFSAALNSGSLTYTVKVKNTGTGNLTPSVALHFSTDSVPSTDDYVLTQISVGSLAGGSEKTLIGTVAVPSTVPGGTYYLAAIVDPANAVVETDETNNGAVAGQFAVSSDLGIGAVSATVSGGNLSYSVTVRNGGNLTASPSVGLYLSADATATTGDYLVGNLSGGSVPSGTERTLTGSTAVSATIPPGTYYIAAIADPAKAIVETDETNNGAVGNQLSVARDLRITGLAGTVASGYLSYSVTVRNEGNASTTASITTLYLSADAIPATSDYRVAQVSTVALAGSTEKILTGLVAVPATIPPGNYYVVGIADTNNTVAETEETNNGATGNQQTLTNDLEISAVVGTVSAGSLSYTLKVKNNGNGSASPSVGLYLSADATATTGDYLVSNLSASVVAGGTEKTLAGSVTIPATIPPGTYYVAAIADPAKTIVETDETNNGMSGNQLAISRDLRITAVSGTVAGGKLAYSVTVRNDGSVATGASTTTLYLSSDAVPSTTDYKVTQVATAALAGGTERIYTGSAVLPATIQPETYYVVGIADTGNTVAETEETNNGATGNQQTLTNDLEISAISGTVSAGSLSYTVKVKNNGGGNPSPLVGLYLSADGTAATTDYLVSTRSASVVAGGTEKTLTGSVTVPATIPPGTYYVAAIADPARVIVETDETNNGTIGNQQSVNRDLRIPAVSGTVVGGNLSYSVSVRNEGNVATAASTTTLYLSVDAVPSTSDYQVTQVATAALAGGTEKSYTSSAALPATIPTGTYYVVGIADTGNTVTETDETNNGATGNQQALAYDLEITAISGIVSAGSLSYTVKVKNNGSGNPSPSVGLYLSTAGTAAIVDYLIKSISAGVVAGGTEKTLTGSVAVPATIPSGTYYVAAIADPARVIVETDETNNGTIGNQLEISRDLRITAVSGTVAGGKLAYSVTVRNDGSVATGASTTTLYLSSDAVPSTTDYKVTQVATAALAGGTERIYTGSAVLPATIQPGNYYVVGIADTGNTVAETEETNNGATGNQQALTNDLEISAVVGTVNAGSLSYTVKVKNNGGGNPSPSVGLYLSADGTATTTDYLVSTRSASMVAGGTEKTLTGSVAVPATIPPGTYFLAAIADPARVIVETDETNNAMTGQPVIIARDLAVTAVSGTVSTGVLSFSVTTRNSGNVIAGSSATTVYLSTDAIPSSNDYRITQISNGTIPGDTVKTFTGSATIPITVPPGTYYVVAIADTGNVVKETDETNNGATGNIVVR